MIHPNAGFWTRVAGLLAVAVVATQQPIGAQQPNTFVNPVADTAIVNPRVEYLDGRFVITSTDNGLRAMVSDNLVDWHTEEQSHSTESRLAKANKPYTIERNGYYYIFFNRGNSNHGELSNSMICTARSRYPSGPFITREGDAWNDNRPTRPAMRANEVIFSPCSLSFHFTDNDNQEWVLYNAVVGEQAEYADCTTWQRLCLDRLHWTDEGWCYIGNGTPVLTRQTSPKINQQLSPK